MEFTAIYKTYYPQIWHYCANILLSHDVVDYEELAQDFSEEAFISAFEKWATFKSELNIKRFLYICVKHKAFNKLEEIKRRDKDHKSLAFLCPQGEMPSFVDFDMITSDVIAFIYSEVENLPPPMSSCN